MDISILLIALSALVLNWFAYRKGFYRFHKTERKEIPVSLTQMLGCFGIYLVFSLILAPLFAKSFLSYLSHKDPSVTSLSITTISCIQLLTMSIIFLCMLLFMMFQNRQLLMRIWKDRSVGATSSIGYDFGMGVIAWFLSFPIVVVVNDLLDTLIVAIFGPKQYEQAAVSFVKTAMQNPQAIIMSVTSVLVFAPVVEEFLFRGCLQNYLKQHFGFKASLLITAFCFALFHLTPAQGIGNFSFTISLFILGLFLGFLYEKQGSLFTSIGLHTTFNLVSAMRILFIPEV